MAIDRKFVERVAAAARLRGGIRARLMGRIVDHPDLKPFLDSLFANPELLIQTGVTLPRPSFDDAEVLPVETEATPEQMSRLMAHVERVWRRLGSEDPHWSVLTDEKYRAEKIDSTIDDFHETGRTSVQQLLCWLEHTGVPVRGEILELGCGVGRVTRWLAQEYTHVHACDISESHLRVAREHLKRAGLTNVSWHKIASEEALTQLPEFDALYSMLVLQHNPPPVIASILRTLLRKLRPGGIACFQAQTFIRGYRFVTSEYLAQPLVDHMEMHCIPQRKVFEIAVAAGCSPVEVQQDNCASRLNDLSTTFLLKKL